MGSNDQLRKLRKLQRRMEGVGSFVRYILGSSPLQKDVNEYALCTGRLYVAIASEAGASYVIDSSKSARRHMARPLMLSRLYQGEVRVIHMVRDGRAVAHSVVRSRGGVKQGRIIRSKAVNFLRAVIGWTAANWAALRSRKTIGEDNVFVLRYEDLCVDPERSMKELASFLGWPAEPLLEAIGGAKVLDKGHAIGGNRLRHTNTLRFRPDQSPGSGKHWLANKIFWVIGGRVAKALGYEKAQG